MRPTMFCIAKGTLKVPIAAMKEVKKGPLFHSEVR